MSDSKNPVSVSEAMKGWKERAAEHQRRMVEDPAYRASVEEDERRFDEEQRARMRAAAEQARLDGIKYRRVRAAVPPRVWPLLDSPKETTALRTALDFATGGGTLLVLAGGVGCGKTVGACAAAEAFARAAEEKRGNGYGPQMCSRKDSLFVKAIDLARAGSFDREFWADLDEPRFLVIDDVGTEPLDEKGWALANLLGLLDSRYDNLSKTILTTNLPFQRFKARYCQDGGRLQDRLAEAGAFVELTDSSFRVPLP